MSKKSNKNPLNFRQPGNKKKRKDRKEIFGI